MNTNHFSSRRASLRRMFAAFEWKSGHSDAYARADLILDIDDQFDARPDFKIKLARRAGITKADLDHLYSGQLTTEQLRAILERLKSLGR